MAAPIPTAVGDLDDELENAVFNEKQGLPSSTATSTRRVFLVLVAIPPMIYIFVGLFTVILAYCTQISLDTQNAGAAHNYLNTKNQQSKIAVTTGQKQQSSNFPGRFALFLETARSGDAKTTQLCLRNEQNVDEVDHLGRTALHWAALSGSDEVLSLLLRNGASIDQQDTLDGLRRYTTRHSMAMSRVQDFWSVLALQ
ncbi:Ankyrin repeat-containing domain [Phytophthora cactorum]|nr:Ankyrin repeat-containing domain [Phytophthora cactorum]